MSGPKISDYEIERRKKEQERKKKIEKINKKISKTKSLLNDLSLQKEYAKKFYANWIKEIEDNFRKNPNNLNGTLNSIQKIEKLIKDELKNETKQTKENLFNEKKKEILTKELENLKEDFKEILNEGVLKRIEILTKAISLNPNNQQTISQIEDLKANLNQKYEQYIKEQEEKEIVKKAFEEIFNTTSKSGEDGNIEIVGEINGVTIKVEIDSKSNNINFDTPSDKNCIKAMEDLQNKLLEKNVKLGPIRALKSGIVINQQNSIKTKKRIKQ